MAWLEKRTLWQIMMIAFICGALMSFALPPFFFMPVCFLGFTVLVLLFDCLKHHPKKHLTFFSVSWFFGLGYFIFGLWWIGGALTFSDSVKFFFIPLSVFVLSAGLALFWGLAGFICSLFWRHSISRFFWIAFSFGLCEWLRGTLFTGFPWNSIGYTAMPTPLLMQAAAIFSIYGINLLSVFIYSAPAVFFSHERKIILIPLVLILCAANIGFGYYRLAHSSHLVVAENEKAIVRIIQPSIAQNLKLDESVRVEILNKILNLIELPWGEGQKPDIIVWPETSLPYYLDIHPEIRHEIAAAMPDNSFSLIGTTRRSGNNETNVRYFNSIQVIDKGGNIIGISDKMHLVPFGEYLPFSSFLKAIGFDAVAEVTGGYSTGTMRYSVTLPNGFTYLPLICYEIIFPTETDYKGVEPSFIVNVTNDAWYGNTPGPVQHFHQAQIRAVEQGLPVVRAANNGISAVIDAYGRPIKTLGYNEIGVIDETIPPASVPIWNKYFNLFALFGIFFIFTFATAYFCRIFNWR